MEKYEIEGKIAELQDCVAMCDENLDSTEKGSFTEAVLKDCKNAYIKHIADLEAILNLLLIHGVVGSAFVEIPKPYIEDADTIEVDGGIYVVAGRVSKCYISKEDLGDVIHIAN